MVGLRPTRPTGSLALAPPGALGASLPRTQALGKTRASRAGLAGRPPGVPGTSLPRTEAARSVALAGHRADVHLRSPPEVVAAVLPTFVAAGVCGPTLDGTRRRRDGVHIEGTRHG